VSNENERKTQIANGSMRRKNIFKFLMDEIILKNFQDIKTNFIEDVILPSTVDWLYDVGESFVGNMFKSPGGGSRGSTLPKQYGRTSYSNYYKSSSRSSRRDYREEADENDVASYEDINFKSRAEAEKILAAMRDDLKHGYIVSVMDLCDYSGVGSSWADNSYGWTSLDKARVIRGRDGKFYLDLPKPHPIDND